MKKIILVILNLIFLIPAATMSQEIEKSNLSFGLNFGVGQNINGYRMTPDKYNFNYYEGDVHFTSGINVGYFASEKFRPRFEFRYSEMKYGLNWSEQYSEFDRTETKLFVLNFNLNFDYMLLNTNKFQLFVSPGIVSEFIKDRQHRNYLTDGTNNIKNYSVVTQQYSEEIAGLNLSLIAKYKFNENLGLTITPGYNYYLKKWLPSNDKNYTRTLLNVGIEYSIPF